MNTIISPVELHWHTVTRRDNSEQEQVEDSAFCTIGAAYQRLYTLWQNEDDVLDVTFDHESPESAENIILIEWKNATTTYLETCINPECDRDCCEPVTPDPPEGRTNGNWR